MTEQALDRARGGDEAAFRAVTEPYRRELHVHCYRILGSVQDAEDAMQETMLAAWRGLDRFEERASLRAWLYRIATNRCLNALRDSARRPHRRDPSAALPFEPPEPTRLGEPLWLEPYPDAMLGDTALGPEARYSARESVTLAFMIALHLLPPRQRAVLILCEVLRWKATEAAELLDTSVASVNSALQRARATLDAADIQPTDSSGEIDAEQRDLLDRYLDSFERYDMEALTTLLAEDATLSMPPYSLWMQGPEDIVAWMVGPGHGCEGSRMVETVANGSRAFGQYRRSEDGEGHEPWGLHVLETRDGRITAINVFLDTASLFPVFGLPPRL